MSPPPPKGVSSLSDQIYNPSPPSARYMLTSMRRHSGMVGLPVHKQSTGSFVFVQDKSIQFTETSSLFIDAKARHLDRETQVNYLDGPYYRDDD